MRALDALRAYGAHPDPATRIANTIALLVGFNGPFYPLYVWFLVPEAGHAALATMAMSPVFLAIPWLSRRSAAAGRAALPVAGLANTVWTAALLGPAVIRLYRRVDAAFARTHRERDHALEGLAP